MQVVVRSHEVPDLVHWQGNQHSSNLGSQISHDSDYEVVDALSDLVLQVRVLLSDCWHQPSSGCLEASMLTRIGGSLTRWSLAFRSASRGVLVAWSALVDLNALNGWGRSHIVRSRFRSRLGTEQSLVHRSALAIVGLLVRASPLLVQLAHLRGVEFSGSDQSHKLSDHGGQFGLTSQKSALLA